MTASEIDALVRALLGPYPRAFTQVAGQQVAIRGVERVAPAADGPDGRRQIAFPCRDGLVYLLPDSPPGTERGLGAATGRLARTAAATSSW